MFVAPHRQSGVANVASQTHCQSSSAAVAPTSPTDADDSTGQQLFWGWQGVHVKFRAKINVQIVITWYRHSSVQYYLKMSLGL